MRVLVILSALAAALMVVLALVVMRADLSAETVYLEAAKALLNLIVALLITGVLSYVLAQRARRQAQADEKARVLTSALQDLKAGYERIQVARFHLSALSTAKGLSEQIGAISEARSRLHRVQRERFVLDTEVDHAVQRMLDYLSRITDEYRQKYGLVAELALEEEKVRQQVLSGERERLGPVARLDANTFPEFTRFTDDSQWRGSEFHRAYRDAKERLQEWLESGRTRRVASA